MIHIAICDDEEYFSLQEKKLIAEYMEQRKYSYEIDMFSSGKELLEIKDAALRYDVIFLDISMEEIDGIETARRIRKISSDTYIVFVTAYITYALEGYKVNAIRYLLKEDNNFKNALKECLDAIVIQINYEEVKLEFDFQNGKRSIPVDKILYVESRLHKVVFVVMENEMKEYYRYDKLDSVEQALGQYDFCRVHQSFLVNMKYVKDVKRYKILLGNGIEISISKKYYKDTEMKLIKMRGNI